MMIRAAILLILAGTFVGCGEPEAPRFVPAGPESAVPSRKSAGDPTREATPPKNIATH